MQAQHTDRQKAVPMFNAFQSKGQDDISRWLVKVSENPIVEAFPEKIDIHPGMDSSMLLSTEMPAIYLSLSLVHAERWPISTFLTVKPAASIACSISSRIAIKKKAKHLPIR